MPVNDSANLTEEGRTHWSCVLYNKIKDEFYHFDSYNKYNLPSAKKIANKFSLLLKRELVKVTVTSVTPPQQPNSYDCAPCMCWLIESLDSDIVNGNAINLEYVQKVTLTDLHLVKKRLLMAYLLLNTSTLNDNIFMFS